MTFFTIIYVLLAIAAWPIFAATFLQYLQHDTPNSRLDAGDYAVAAFTGLFLASIWPLVLVTAGMAYGLWRFNAAMADIRRQAAEHEDASR